MENGTISGLNAIGIGNQRSLSVEMMPVTALLAGASIEASSDSVLQRDQRLVCAAQAGSQKAFDELMNLYSRRVHWTILRITKNPEDAEDAMQDTFLRAFLALGRFEGRASFFSWLTRIAINSALMVLRRRRNRQEHSLSSSADWNGEFTSMDFTDLAADPEEVYSQQQRRALLNNAIRRLNPSLRETLRARVEEDCSIKEIAEKCNISEAAAKSRLLRARRHLDRLCAHGHDSRVGGESLRAC